jgi:hypothetical protein
MGLIEQVLDEFDGQLSKTEIEHMTFKELQYLRDRREKRKLMKAKASSQQNKLPDIPIPKNLGK